MAYQFKPVENYNHNYNDNENYRPYLFFALKTAVSLDDPLDLLRVGHKSFPHFDSRRFINTHACASVTCALQTGLAHISELLDAGAVKNIHGLFRQNQIVRAKVGSMSIRPA